MGRPRVYATAAERQAAYRARKAKQIEKAMGIGSLRRIRRLEAVLERTVRRAEKAEATVAELRAQLAVKPKPPRQRDAARIRALESMTALLYDELQAEKAKKGLSPEHYFTQPNRAQRRAAERNRRRP